MSIFAIGFYIFYKEGSLAFNKNDKSTKIFVITRGESLNNIINNLYKENLIRNKLVFRLIVERMGISKSIQAGDFRLSASMDAYQIAKTLTHGTLDVWITLKEGTRVEEIAQVIGKELNIPESEFIKEAKEGYMFPDTYLVPKNAIVGSVISIIRSNTKFTSILKKIPSKNNLSEKEVITLASIVEREAKDPQGRRQVAKILLKRLKEDWPLQVDATIQYALGYQAEERSWWKKNLSIDNLKIDSPYNSYTNKGLPPSPISNPGLDSIKAVMQADINTPYWYYISDKLGNMHYAKTIEEHNKNINKYLR